LDPCGSTALLPAGSFYTWRKGCFYYYTFYKGMLSREREGPAPLFLVALSEGTGCSPAAARTDAEIAAASPPLKRRGGWRHYVAAYGSPALDVHGWTNAGAATGRRVSACLAHGGGPAEIAHEAGLGSSALFRTRNGFLLEILFLCTAKTCDARRNTMALEWGCL